MRVSVLFLALLSPLLAVATEGWTLPPRRHLLPDDGKAWFAPVDKGAAAFEVKKADGAQGEVSFAGGTIRVVKTNDKGYIRIVPRQAVEPVPKMQRFRVSAEVESSSVNPREAQCYVRIGKRNGKGDVFYSMAGDGKAHGGWQKLNQLISTPPGRPQLKVAHFIRAKGETNDMHVAIYVKGGPSVSEWRNLRVDTMQEVELTNFKARKGHYSRDFAADMVDSSVLDAKLAADFDHTAKVVKKNGYACLEVDGKVVPPIFYKCNDSSGTRLHFNGKRMHKTGFPLLVASVRFGSTALRESSWSTNGFNAAMAVETVRRSMLTAPDALYVITMRLDAPAYWCDSRTNEIWRTEKGEIVYGNAVHAGRKFRKGDPPSWPWVSYHSKVWRDEVKKVLTAFFDELKRSGLSKRIVGYHIGGYHDAQFATACPDWSGPARKAFAASGLKDYTAFLKRAPMDIQDDFGGHIRKCAGKQVVLFRWCMSAFGSGFCSSHDIREFADSKQLDIIVPQVGYANRSPGYALGVKAPFSSFHLNGKLLVHEHDLRTYAVWSGKDTPVRDAGLSMAADIDEWRSINRKTTGQMIARRTGFWYFDMESGWYDRDEIAADISAAIKDSAFSYLETPNPWRPTAVFAIDEKDLLGLQQSRGACIQPKADINKYIEEIAASGVPFDVFMKGDLDRHPDVAAAYRYRLDYNRDTPQRKAAQINAEAKAAGAYVPLPPNVVQVDMNGDFISVHCLVSGKYGFRLPRKCKVVNIKSAMEEPAEGGVLPLDLKAGQTSWFRLKEFVGCVPSEMPVR